MTANRHLKRKVRARMKRTGERYCQALKAIKKERAERECFACGERGHVRQNCPTEEES